MNETRTDYRVMSEREKQILYINAYMESRKMESLTLCEGRKHRCKEQTVGLSGKGERGMICVNSIETYILPYVK